MTIEDFFYVQLNGFDITYPTLCTLHYQLIIITPRVLIYSRGYGDVKIFPSQNITIA